MAADDYMAMTFFQGNNHYQAALRFYTWSPPAVSLGTHQSADEIDHIACKERGWDIVHRSTGGRSLLHLNDISYAVVVITEGDIYAKLMWLYNSIAKAIITTLAELGIRAANTQSSFKHNINQDIRKARLCLISRTRGEVHVNGRKIAAASQRIYRHNILQHGSIMLHGDPGRIAEAAPIAEYKRSSLADTIRSQATTLKNVNGQCFSAEKIAGVLAENMGRCLELELITDNWTSDEIDEIHLQRSKFELLPFCHSRGIRNCRIKPHENLPSLVQPDRLALKPLTSLND